MIYIFGSAVFLIVVDAVFYLLWLFRFLDLKRICISFWRSSTTHFFWHALKASDSASDFYAAVSWAVQCDPKSLLLLHINSIKSSEPKLLRFLPRTFVSNLQGLQKIRSLLDSFVYFLPVQLNMLQHLLISINRLIQCTFIRA